MIEILKNTSDDYSFTVRTESGSSLLNSIVYSSRKKVEEDVHYLKSAKTNRNAIERRTNHSGKFLFSLKNKNGNIIGSSQPYQSEAGMENGIKNIITRINALSS